MSRRANQAERVAFASVPRYVFVAATDNSLRKGMTDRPDDSFGDDLAGLLPRLWRFAYVLARSRDTAGDLVQATCLRAIERRHLFQPDSRLDAWTFTIMSSIWKNQLRAEKVRMGQGFVDPETALTVNGQHKAETNIFLRQVLDKVMILPEAQRSTVLLVYGEGLSYQEAADILEIPIGTVMSRLAAARKTLAALKRTEQPADDVNEESKT